MADEKIYTVPLGKAYDYVRTKRARRAVAIVGEFVARHAKVAGRDVRLSNALNSALWARGIQKPPRRIRIKVVKDGGLAKAYLQDEQIKKPEPKKEKKEEAKPEGKKEGAAPEKKAEKTPEKKPAEKVPEKIASRAGENSPKTSANQKAEPKEEAKEEGKK